MKTTDLRLSHLTKAYGDQLVLKDFSTTLRGGGTYCLMAPSGAGKTTLLRILMGLEKPDSGMISGLSSLRVSAVFQEDRLLLGYSPLENLRFVTGNRFTEKELTDFLLCLLPADSLKKPVREFSGGMKRRTAILRALLAPADLVLMDEPFTGLDSGTKLCVISMIKKFCTQKTLLVSTHAEEDAVLLDAELLRLSD